MRLAGWGDAAPPGPQVATEALALAIVGAVVAAIGLRTARTRAAINRLATQLADPATALRQSTGAIRGVQFAMPNDGRRIDAAGQDVGGPPAPSSYLVLPDVSARSFSCCWPCVPTRARCSPG